MTDARPAVVKPRVLVIDDQPAHIRDIYQALARDCQVLQATSGERGLQLAQERAPDLVLLDVGMPEMDGYAALAALRGTTTPPPVVLLTEPGDGADRPRGLALGAVGFLAKPVDPARLRAAVDAWVRRPAPATPAVPSAGLNPDAMRRLAGVPGLDPAVGLSHVAGSESLYLTVLGKLVADHADLGPQIARALAEGATGRAVALAHTAKTLCTTVGAADLGRQAMEIERHLKTDAPGQPATGAFATAYAALIGAIRQAILPAT